MALAGVLCSTRAIITKTRYNPAGIKRCCVAMAKILDDLHSPEWWFTAVFVALIVGVAAPLITNLFVVLITRQRAANFALRLHAAITGVGILVLVYEMIIRAPSAHLPLATLIVALVIVIVPAIGILYGMFAKERPSDFIVATLTTFVAGYFLLGGFPSTFTGWLVRYGATSCICWIVTWIAWWCTGGVRRRLVAKITGANLAP